MMKNIINIIKIKNGIKKSMEPTNISYFWNFMYNSLKNKVMQIVTRILLAMHFTAHVDLAFNSIKKKQKYLDGVFLSQIAEESVAVGRKFTRPLIEDLEIDIKCILDIQKEIFAHQIYNLQNDYYYNMLLEDGYIEAWESMLKLYFEMYVSHVYRVKLTFTPEVLQDIKEIAINIIYEKNMPVYGEALYERGFQVTVKYFEKAQILNEKGDILPKHVDINLYNNINEFSFYSLMQDHNGIGFVIIIVIMIIITFYIKKKEKK